MEELAKSVKKLLDENKCLNEICAELNVNRNVLYRIRKKYDLKFFQKRIYFFNEDYFKLINTKERAYWLGFIYADGYIKKGDYALVFNLSIKDKVLLEKFCKEINLSIEKIQIQNTRKHIVELQISSKEIVSDLGKLGCVNKKSLIIRLPNLGTRELDLSFLSGFFDGDGSANTSSLCSGSIKFLEDIKKKYELKFEIKKNNTSNCWILNLGAKLKREMMLNYIDSLERKRNTYKGDKGYRTDGINYSGLDRISQRKFNISKEELEILLKEKSLVSIGKMFGVSGNSIKKRAIRFGLIILNKQKE